MIINKDIQLYSKHYFITLTDSSFKEVLSQKTISARLKAYLPLYSTINRNYGLITNPTLLRSVSDYIDIVANDKDDEIFQKFKTSMYSYFKLKTKRPQIKKMAIKKIRDIITKQSISPNTLNESYGVNPKIYNQIKNKNPVSMSIVSINQLYIKLNKDYT